MVADHIRPWKLVELRKGMADVKCKRKNRHSMHRVLLFVERELRVPCEVAGCATEGEKERHTPKNHQAQCLEEAH